MPLAVYATDAEFKARVVTGTSLPSSQDAIVTAVVAAASRLVDEWCGRYFYALAATDRYQDGAYGGELVLDEDLVSITTIVTDDNLDGTHETTWVSSDYHLEPTNASAREWPYSLVRVAPLSVRSFPIGRRTVKITGTWGWPVVPAQVKEATLLEAERMFQASKSPSGVVANEGMGTATTVPALHPTTRKLLAPFRRMRMGATSG